MGKYGGLSGQYYYRTKKEAVKALTAAKKHVKKHPAEHRPGFVMGITGSRGFWTLTITKRRAKKGR